MLPVIFSSVRPTDGVETVDGAPYPGNDEISTKVLRGRTDRQEAFDLEITDLSNPVVIEFINADGEGRLADFVGRFGFPYPHLATPYVFDLHVEARLCHSALDASTTGDISARVRWLDQTLSHAPLNASYRLSGPDGRGQLVLRAKSLVSFMSMEIALAHEAGAEPRACEHCGKLFLVGHLTERRGSSLYCSDSCRVMASRKRTKKEKDVSHVGS